VTDTLSVQNMERDAPWTAWSKMLQPHDAAAFFSSPIHQSPRSHNSFPLRSLATLCGEPFFKESAPRGRVALPGG
jgi:hypothetical protein